MFLSNVFRTLISSDLTHEEQDWPNQKTTPAQNKTAHSKHCSTCPWSKIALVTHSTWLKYYMNDDLTSEPELGHCVAYPLRYNIHA